MRKTIAKAITWRLIGTAEIFAISFWTTGHIATAGSMAGIAAISSLVMYVAHELAWEVDVRESIYSCWDDLPARYLRPDLFPVTSFWSRHSASARSFLQRRSTISGIATQLPKRSKSQPNTFR